MYMLRFYTIFCWLYLKWGRWGKGCILSKNYNSVTKNYYRKTIIFVIDKYFEEKECEFKKNLLQFVT